jgi:hypothetical protein
MLIHVSAATVVSITAPTTTISSTVKNFINGADLSCATATDGELPLPPQVELEPKHSKDNGTTFRFKCIQRSCRRNPPN